MSPLWFRPAELFVSGVGCGRGEQFGHMTRLLPAEQHVGAFQRVVDVDVGDQTAVGILEGERAPFHSTIWIGG